MRLIKKEIDHIINLHLNNKVRVLYAKLSLENSSYITTVDSNRMVKNDMVIINLKKLHDVKHSSVVDDPASQQ